jgi:hypothetical protein
MVAERKTIEVEAGSELAEILDEAADAPLILAKNGVRYRLQREDEEIWANYDPERALEGMRAAAGTWKGIDAEAFKAYIYRAREEGTRPPDRP